MREPIEERRRKIREYLKMIRRNDPVENARYKQAKADRIAKNKAKYSDKEWFNAYHKARRSKFPSEIKRKQAIQERKLQREKELDSYAAEIRLKRDEIKKLNDAKIKLIANIRCASAQFCRRNIQWYNGKIHNIHHIFGWSRYSFIILYKTDHVMLHKKYGWDNKNISWYDEKIRAEVLKYPYCLVCNKKIIKNTLI